MATVSGKALHEYRSHFGEPPGVNETPSEQQRWQQLCQELLEQRDRLRQELAQSREEAELYRRALQKLLPVNDAEHFNLGYEEAKKLAAKEPPLEDLIADIERSFGDDHG